MKRIIAVILCLCILGILSVSALAADFAVDLTPDKTELKAGEKVTITVKIVGDVSGSSAAFYVNADKGLTVNKGEITNKDVTMSQFDPKTNKAVAMFSGDTKLSGEFAKVTLTANEKASGKQKVEIGVLINSNEKSAKSIITFEFEEKPGSSSAEQTSSEFIGETEDNKDKPDTTDTARTTEAEDTVTTGADNNKTLIIVFLSVAAVLISAIIAIAVLKIKKKK